MRDRMTDVREPVSLGRAGRRLRVRQVDVRPPHFKPTEVISSDFCRGLVADDENDQAATEDAFDVLHYIAGKRLAPRPATVVDATNVQQEAARAADRAGPRARRARRSRSCSTCPRRSAPSATPTRPDRDFGPHVIRRQRRDCGARCAHLQREGFRKVHVLRGARRSRPPRSSASALWTDRRDRPRPVRHHRRRPRLPRRAGERCSAQLGYVRRRRHPGGPHARVFVGDLSTAARHARRAAPGHGHGRRRARARACPATTRQARPRTLDGRKVQHHPRARRDARAAGRREPRSSAPRSREFIDGLVSHSVLDGGRLVVAHAGLPEQLPRPRLGPGARASPCTATPPARPTSSACRCATRGPTDYRGRATVVYGHTPVPEPEWINNTICLDTGCVFGGKLTALR